MIDILHIYIYDATEEIEELKNMLLDVGLA